MPYNIYLPNSTLLTTIEDGTIDNTASSLTLVGRNYSGYGAFIATDLVALLVNFAKDSAPNYQNTGQLWYDTGNKTLKVWTGTSWKNVGSCTSQSSAPSTTIAGDLWWDSTNKQLYCYDGTTPYSAAGWILVGPGYSTVYGKSTAIWEQLTVGTSTYNVVSLYLDGTRPAIISSSSFTPSPAITGFSTIRAGWNMNSNYTIYGTANNASYLGNQPATNYLRTDIDGTTYGNLIIAKNGGLTVGLSGNLEVTTDVNSNANIRNTKNNGDISFYANVAGVDTKVFGLNGATGTASLLSATLSGNLTLGAGATVTGALNVTGTGAFTGNLNAPTQAQGVSDTTVATTEWVNLNSGIFKYKIYQGNSHMWINDSGVGGANLVVDGVTVMTATKTGINLETQNGATANVSTATRGESGINTIATTAYVRQAGEWWGNASHRSAKIISTDAPSPGVNDTGSLEGDFWFQIEL